MGKRRTPKKSSSGRGSGEKADSPSSPPVATSQDETNTPQDSPRSRSRSPSPPGTTYFIPCLNCLHIFGISNRDCVHAGTLHPNFRGRRTSTQRQGDGRWLQASDLAQEAVCTKCFVWKDIVIYYNEITERTAILQSLQYESPRVKVQSNVNNSNILKTMETCSRQA